MLPVASSIKRYRLTDIVKCTIHCHVLHCVDTITTGNI